MIALRGAALLLATGLLASPAARADEVLSRMLDSSSGLGVNYCGNVKQDASGFLWIGTPGGVFRYDGQTFHRVLRENASPIGGSPSETMLLRDIDGGLWRSDGDAASPVPGPDGRPVRGSAMAAVTGDGALWAVLGGRLARRADDGSWRDVDSPCRSGLDLLFPDRGASVLAACDDGLVRIAPDGRAATIVRSGGPMALRVLEDRSIVYGCVDGSVHRWTASGDAVLFRDPHRLIDVDRRGTTTWVAYDYGIVALADGAPPVPVRWMIGEYGGGPLLTDREGSLWVATPHGLVQLPEPDTRIAQGTGGGRSFLRVGGVVWHALWGGLERLDSREVPETWRRVATPGNSPVCADAGGRVWQASAGAFRVWETRGSSRAIPVPGLTSNFRCATGAGGALWLPTNLGVFRLEPGARAPRLLIPRVPGLGPEGLSPYRVFESPRHDLFVGRGETMCRADASEVLLEGPVAWTCQTVPGSEAWAGFAAMPSGETWAAAGHQGFQRYRGGRWEPIPASAGLPSQWTHAIVPNPDGTAWLTGSGFAVRVAELASAPEGWKVVEQLGPAQGVPRFNIADALEDGEGGVWLSNDTGVVRVPARVRHAVAAPPAVALVEASIDGKPIDAGEALRLPYRDNRLELRFAAASYRDPALLRYRSRLRPDEPWSPPTASPLFRFVGVAPGAYRVEVEATLDGARWSAAPALFAFRVARPWYLEPWAFLAALGTAIGAAYAVHRARVAVLLRLERQRARIAMDLHDELGSGLGTIGILAGVASRPGVESERREALAERIAAVSRQLGESLTDMVWTLRPGAGNAASLAAHLRERGEAMFPGPEPALEVDFPDPVPPVPVSLGVRRNVALVGLEALHNAARHSGATRVRLALAPGRRTWTLTVADDGRGLAASARAAPGHGTGLDAMRRRAAQIGATLTVDAAEDGGTIVTLAFRPEAGEA